MTYFWKSTARPNRGAGRNFNNGEVIQLVLKSPATGRWLPFKFVQMVMMHELAHNKQMNHSAAFHKVRIEFTEEMKVLWEKGYTGDGLWGNGKSLGSGDFPHADIGHEELLPEHLCGGMFKSKSGRKRKLKPKITYKERQERRIKKKFGTGGEALGADDIVKVKLEKGKRQTGKPRVASSARGRELRAAAALARFETKDEPLIMDEDLVTDSEAESLSEDNGYFKLESEDAIDGDGRHLYDRNGVPFVKVCEEENENDENIKKELLALQGFTGQSPQAKPDIPIQTKATSPRHPSLKPNKKSSADTGTQKPKLNEQEMASKPLQNQNVHNQISTLHFGRMPRYSCPACSVENEQASLICDVCLNVLKLQLVPGSWRCKNLACKDTEYTNAGDVALCGVCGNRKTP
jgi:hypothetical protein